MIKIPRGISRIQVIDDSQTINDPQPLLRHQLGDHLESSSLELDEQGDLISYEEYYPYGSTSYQAVDNQTEVSAKRYRFTGKERDEESGLYYHGARYYAPWLARWTAPDPAGMVDGVNLYQYVRGNPVTLVDPDGRESGEQNVSQAISEAVRVVSQATSASPRGRQMHFSAFGDYPSDSDTLATMLDQSERDWEDQVFEEGELESETALGEYYPWEDRILVTPDVFENLFRPEGMPPTSEELMVPFHELFHAHQSDMLIEQYRGKCSLKPAPA